ncbi:MAG: cytochrome P460 family protein [Fimbriimonadales bacterium]
MTTRHSVGAGALLLVAFFATACFLPASDESNSGGGRSDSQIKDYQSWHLVNTEPVLMDLFVATLCVPTPPQYAPDNPHMPKYIKVYVNDIGTEAMLSAEPIVFPVGSVIVKEKLKKVDEKKPELLTIMIKRAVSTPPSVQDWEFITSTDQKHIAKGGDVSHCVSCHTGQQETDFVYKSYLNKK